MECFLLSCEADAAEMLVLGLQVAVAQLIRQMP